MGVRMASSATEEHSPIWVDGPIIVGAGPSGLAVAACLSLHRVPSLILEKCSCLASLWQERAYDRLKLHLPRKYCELPHLRFPKNFPEYPTKDQFISYMNTYASFFNLRPLYRQTVQNVVFDSTRVLWIVQTQNSTFTSRWLIVATGENAEPVVPDIPGKDLFHGVSIHTSAYKSGSDYVNQKVLVIGCGNSGMEVSFDLSKHGAIPHMVIRNNVHVLPKEVLALSTFGIAMSLLKWLNVKLVDRILLIMAKLVLGNTERVGLPRPKLGPLELKGSTGKTPVLDSGAVQHIKSGKILVKKGVREITRNGARFVNGEELEFDAIIFATGYMSNVPTWLKGSDFFDEKGMPRAAHPNHWKSENGLYTVGFSRKGLLGSSADALQVAGDIARQWTLHN